MVDILNYLRVFLTKLQLGRDHLVGKFVAHVGLIKHMRTQSKI
jgi:hypothetical protein